MDKLNGISKIQAEYLNYCQRRAALIDDMLGPNHPTTISAWLVYADAADHIAKKVAA